MQSHDCGHMTVVEGVAYSGTRRGPPLAGRRSRTCSGRSAGPPRSPCRHIVLWQTHTDPYPGTPLGHSRRLGRGERGYTIHYMIYSRGVCFTLTLNKYPHKSSKLHWNEENQVWITFQRNVRTFPYDIIDVWLKIITISILFLKVDPQAQLKRLSQGWIWPLGN